MKLITDRDEIAKAQNAFANSITSKSSSMIPVSIGYQSGHYTTEVHWSLELGFWAYFGYPPGEKSPGERYWNVFGLGRPSGMVSIVCEINPPVQGINRRAAGGFAKEPSGQIHLIHRGILNARGRIEKEFVYRNFRGNFVYINDVGQRSKVIDIGNLLDGDFPKSLRDFIFEVDRVKDIVRSQRGG